MNPEIEKVAFALPVGSVSEPLPVEGGSRSLKVTAKTSGSVTPYDAAKDRVRDRLLAARFEKAYDAYMDELRKNASVELRVREVPLQLTGPIPEGSLLEALDPLTPGGGASGPAPAAPAAADTGNRSPEPAPAAPPATDDEITTTPQAGPEKVAPPPPPAVPTPTKEPPPGP